MRPALLDVRPLDVWSDDGGPLTFVAFRLGEGAGHAHGGLAVFAVDDGRSQLVSTRVVALGADGALSRVETLYDSAP
jgi:hypothetical protein